MRGPYTREQIGSALSAIDCDPKASDRECIVAYTLRARTGLLKKATEALRLAVDRHDALSVWASNVAMSDAVAHARATLDAIREAG